MEKSNNASHIIEIPRVNDPRGNLSFIQHPASLPFAAERVSWMYDIGADQFRNSVNESETDRIIVALSGALDVSVDGSRHRLDRAYRGLFVAGGMTACLTDVVTNTVLMTIDAGPATVPEPPVPDSHPRSTLSDVAVYDLERRPGHSGSLTWWRNDDFFTVRRVFYLYDVPAGSERGGHSHYQARELIVAVSGSFDVILDDGKDRHIYHLDRPYQALYVPRGLWRELGNFTSGAVCLVLTTEVFEETDYVRDYKRFLELTAPKRK